MGVLKFLTSLIPGRTARIADELALADILRTLMDQVATAKVMTVAKRTALNLIVPQMAALTIGTFLRDGGRQEKSELHDRLNYGMYYGRTGFAFRQAFYNNLFADNNAYARIGRLTDGGRPLLLTPLENYRVVSSYDRVTDTMRYVVDGSMTAPADLFHVALNSYNGLLGIAYEAEVGCYELAAECEAFAARFYSQGGNIRRVWRLVAGGTPDQEKAAQAFLDSAIQGTLKSHLDVVIPSHIAAPSDLTMPNARESQMIEGRQQQLTEILGLYGVDPKSPNLERLYQITIVPVLESIEQAITRQLLTPEERAKYRIAHIVAGRFRGDTKTQYEIAKTALSVHSVNEIRAWFGAEPLGPEYDAVINPDTASAGVNDARHDAAAGGQ